MGSGQRDDFIGSEIIKCLCPVSYLDTKQLFPCKLFNLLIFLKKQGIYSMLSSQNPHMASVCISLQKKNLLIYTLAFKLCDKLFLSFWKYSLTKLAKCNTCKESLSDLHDIFIFSFTFYEIIFYHYPGYHYCSRKTECSI